MSKAIRILNNEIIEIMDIVNANALFQTYEYPKDEIFYKLRKQINPFDLYYENENKDKEIERLNNIISIKTTYIEDLLKSILKSTDIKIQREVYEHGIEYDRKLKELKEGK